MPREHHAKFISKTLRIAACTLCLHQECRRIKTVPAPGPHSSLTGPQDTSVSAASACTGGPAARQLWATHSAVYVGCQSQKWETHQASPGRNSKHSVTERLPTSSVRCLIGRQQSLREEGSRESERRTRRSQESGILISLDGGLQPSLQFCEAAQLKWYHAHNEDFFIMLMFRTMRSIVGTTINDNNTKSIFLQ